ncbi:bifunctional UDP-2,4-diacetamido-2,4,6-trideoxy-beta-L-altropyranose hydrolase/GNAT family N-acetyltransferase [Pseudonocardia endophytica]|uniref:Spore coat polysaccharide biosynthesis predicted glycosyltransferase SpsG n=1 Tax=Pseudonocardia endophytica TaxID=401976 RepID=A0A4R1HX90_PSEEN|nr:bifunctional UDP-2,4-diacetamido-2,4,6-trideoxy-beta-L-altropyranose hydrolase/GNAT family N-acetyltransferase [Pseudonocardia endophytica]TCK27384.1 spore coat polysaccharide biosynthesis predicted glycosyltransferase SpsG [Pseudonocardia endophytica]
MRLLLRCDAGPATGVGHAVRCAALAEAAIEAGHDVFWSGRLDGLDWLWTGLSRTDRDTGTPPHPGAGEADRPGTLLPPADSADELVALCREHRIDAAHVDHYLLGPELRDALNPHGVVLSTVEDFHTGRRPADVVVDPNLGADAVPRPDDGSPVLLRGPRFAPLRRSVRRARTTREDRLSGRRDSGTASTGPGSAGAAGPTDPPRVLVVMGGTDAAGLLGRVVSALAATGVPADVDVVVPPGRELAVPDGFRTVPPLPDLPGAAADVDLVVSAAGTTVWELCCVGVAMALVRVADNQTEGYRAVTASGVAAGLGSADDLSHPDTTATLRHLLTDPDARAALAARARDVVDGRGADRILDALRTATGDRSLSTRPATSDDAELLLAWRNDPETRRWSRTPSPVTAVEHRAWLERSLADGDRMLLVVSDADGPVGTVRWDHDPDGWEVSITVAPQRRGSGLAGPLLAAGERALRASTGAGTPVTAVVHRDNTASARLFARAGYAPSDAPDADGFGTHRRTLD